MFISLSSRASSALLLHSDDQPLSSVSLSRPLSIHCGWFNCYLRDKRSDTPDLAYNIRASERPIESSRCVLAPSDQHFPSPADALPQRDQN
ncbi:hypothetical protein H9L39_11748 [Fusarium oxysporum f. sp. albedinis]|nr:hypothetical protein H9L39_11748 [Fusarium oxysporum f. sp. albedinis]